MEQLWDRVREGRHTALVGITPTPAPPAGLSVIRVNCDVPARPLGPVLEAQRKITAILGGALPLLDQAADRVFGGLRRRVLGEHSEPTPEATLLTALTRLAHQSLRPVALIFDAVDAADVDTLRLLRGLLLRPGGLPAALVLAFRAPAEELRAEARELLEALRTAGGDAALLLPETEQAAADAGATWEIARAASAPRLPIAALLAGLPGEARRVLRAGALVGSGFEAELLARLLGMDEVAVLEQLQAARDGGAPLEDHGEGRFHLPEPVIAALRGSILPSLSAEWHRRLARLLSQAAGGAAVDGHAGAEALHLPSEELGATPAAPEHPLFAPALDPAAEATRVRLSDGAPLEWPYKEVFAPAEQAAAMEHAVGALHLAKPERAAETGHASGAEHAAPQEPAATQAPAMSAEPPAVSAAPPAMSAAPPAVSAEPSAAKAPAMSASPPAAPAGPTARPVATADHAAPDERPPGAGAGATPRSPGDDPLSALRALFERALQPEPAAAVHTAPSGLTPDPQPHAAAPAPAHAEPRPLHAEPRPLHAEPPRAARPQPVDDEGEGDHHAGSDTDARAAGHYVAAGDVDSGADRFLRAAHQAARVGATAQAAAYAIQALRLTEGLPQNQRRRRLRIRALCELARQQWHGTGEGFTLAEALDSARAARQLVQPEDPSRLLQEASILLAGIYYDKGDLPSLELALDELTRTSRELQAAGDAYGAARLLNDQAAVYIRIGDPVRAAHLLGESRKVFERHATGDRLATRELAETHHLLARLPLHVAARPGREADAMTLGREHAQAAEALYRELRDPREVARLWETLARLELRAGRRPRALAHLQAALHQQQQIGDLIGLARSTATLADLLAAEGRLQEALELLSESIALNLDKGSPLGLAENRRALQQLAAPAQQAGLLRALQLTAQRLDAAQAIVGQAQLPS